MKVRAAVVETKDGPFVFRDVEVDAPRSDEILVRIVATGICHTDAHIRAQGYETPLPLVLGHEGAGIVENVGSDVTSVASGDRVVMSFPSCGRCGHCLSGHPAYCDHNLRLSFGGGRLDGSNAYHDGVHGHFFGQSSFARWHDRRPGSGHSRRVSMNSERAARGEPRRARRRRGGTRSGDGGQGRWRRSEGLGIEAGLRNPSINAVATIARRLGTTLSDLFQTVS